MTETNILDTIVSKLIEVAGDKKIVTYEQISDNIEDDYINDNNNIEYILAKLEVNSINIIEEDVFDFDKHQEDAIEKFERIRPLYEKFTLDIKKILQECISEKDIKIHSIESRTKSIDSFAQKAILSNEANQNSPKYKDPIKNITDLSAIRIITFFQSEVPEICKIIEDNFEVIEKIDKNKILEKNNTLGYKSIHFLVKLNNDRLKLLEYIKYSDNISEIQVRTIMQHAWAEIEHDIEYKSEINVSQSIRRRFLSLAGLLEIADREFQSIHDEKIDLQKSSLQLLAEGKLNRVDITAETLKFYLDTHFGSDGRVTTYSYIIASKRLKDIGFNTIEQIDKCINLYDSDNISRIIWNGFRQGQIARFEDTILAALGENFLKKDPYCTEVSSNGFFWKNIYKNRLKKLIENQIDVGKYNIQ